MLYSRSITSSACEWHICAAKSRTENVPRFLFWPMWNKKKIGSIFWVDPLMPVTNDSADAAVVAVVAVAAVAAVAAVVAVARSHEG